MPTPITMTSLEYEALLNWAKIGAEQNGETNTYEAMRSRVDLDNAITRYVLIIKWEPIPQVYRPGLPTVPKGETKRIELTRKPTLDDVKDVLAGESWDPRLVWVTSDPNGEVGYYDLDQYPWQ